MIQIAIFFRDHMVPSDWILFSARLPGSSQALIIKLHRLSTLNIQQERERKRSKKMKTIFQLIRICMYARYVQLNGKDDDDDNAVTGANSDYNCPSNCHFLSEPNPVVVLRPLFNLILIFKSSSSSVLSLSVSQSKS